MNFKAIKLPYSVKTTEANPNEVFFNPVLSASISYKVAVGYFSSKWVRDVASGIANLASNSGKASLLISPQLSKNDYLALAQGDSNKGNRDDVFKQCFRELYNSLRDDTLTTISWMIADGLLEFKIAVPCNDLEGIMHAKMGVFEDDLGNKIGFSGSYNLTGASKSNWERIDVFTSYSSEESLARIHDIETDFNNMWVGVDKNIETFSPSDSCLTPFIEFTKNVDRPYKKIPKYRIPDFFLDENGDIRGYQMEAVNKWFKANGKGIFCMATGAGKTVTALSATAKLSEYMIEKKACLFVLIVVPYTHLAKQWCKEAIAFGFNPIQCFDGVSKWGSLLSQSLSFSLIQKEGVTLAVCTNATFTAKSFRDFDKYFDKMTSLFLADEMHNLGSPECLKRLPLSANYRLGLSATPKRHNDEEGTDALYQYFGEEVINFSLKDAIESGCLTKYFYFPKIVEFTEEEWEEYKDLSKKISRFINTKPDGGIRISDGAKILLLKRARLINSMKNKYEKFFQLVDEKGLSKHTLVYVGDTKEDDVRAVEFEVNKLGNTFQIPCNKFTAETELDDRITLLQNFAEGKTDVIVAIKCLDEGVDVPSTQHAHILASSTNPREYIQRRGRVLRKSKGKTYAYIHDYIAVPPNFEMDGFSEGEIKIFRNLFKREIKRIEEFAQLAINYGDTLEMFSDIRKKLEIHAS